MNSQTTRRAALRLGASHAYVQSYMDVMHVLEEEDNVHILRGPINTLLSRMLALKQDVHAAAFGLQDELQTQGGKRMVQAAVVDIVLNDRKAGQRITEVLPMAITLARA